MNSTIYPVLAFTLVLFQISACSGGDASDPAEETQAVDSSLPLEAQIGPITSVELDEINPDLVEKGKTIYTLRCSACHQLETAVVGPPLGNILEERSPVYVMNMILNPTEMLEKHPDAQASLAEYIVPMADLGISEEDARAILEYLRAPEM